MQIDEAREFIKFLHGAVPWNGTWFGEYAPGERGAYWWRKHLDEAIAALIAVNDAPPDPDYFTLKIKRNVRPDTINDLARAFFERQDGNEVDAARFRYLIFEADKVWATGLFENGFEEQEIIAMIDEKRGAVRVLPAAPDGWQLAPKIPNESMEAKGAEVLRNRDPESNYEERHHDIAHCVFRAMLEGAPVPPPRDRQADRARYTDPAFNEWLDDSVADGGATVWDLVPDIHSAWAAWTAHPHYAARAAPQMTDAEMVRAEALQSIIDEIAHAAYLRGIEEGKRQATTPQDRSAPARREDMTAFAAELKADSAKAQAFFQSAGIIDERGELMPEYAAPRQAEPVAQIGWADEFGNLFPMGAWKPAQRTHHDSHKAAWRPVFLHPPADEVRRLRDALDEIESETQDVSIQQIARKALEGK